MNRPLNTDPIPAQATTHIAACSFAAIRRVAWLATHHCPYSFRATGGRST
jgi:hypothetical protein